MTLGSRFNRRSFLKTAVVSGGCGVGQLLKANTVPETAASKQIVDTHVYVGGWPHAHLAESKPTALVAMLRRHKVSQAWAGSFDGLFHKDVAGVNERLVEACATAGDKLLIPFGTINPTLPDWEEDVRRCHEQYRMHGIRLHPNYHGYTLDDSRFVRLLQLAAELSLSVQLVAWLDDSPHAWLTPKAPHLDLTRLTEALTTTRGVRMVLAGAAGIVDDVVLASLPKTSEIHFDLSGLRSKTASPTWKKRTALSKLAFGSAAPLQSLKEALTDLETSSLTVGNIKVLRRGDGNEP